MAWQEYFSHDAARDQPASGGCTGTHDRQEYAVHHVHGVMAACVLRRTWGGQEMLAVIEEWPTEVDPALTRSPTWGSWQLVVGTGRLRTRPPDRSQRFHPCNSLPITRRSGRQGAAGVESWCSRSGSRRRRTRPARGDRQCHRHATEPITEPPTGAALPRVVLVRADDPQEPRGELFFPVMCVVVRGAKTVQFGSQSHTFRAGTFVVSAVDFAVTGHVCEVPYRAVAVALRPGLLAELLQVATLPAVRQGPTFVVGTASPQVLDAMSRLVRLLDDPDDGAVLAEAAERELLYRVLQTDAGHALRQVALDGHLASRVDPAIRWLRNHLTDPLDIDTLAEMTHLSASSLYRYFRAATGGTPLQFQKRLRLQEARKLLLVGETNAAGAAARVGYQSPTQFHREYQRLFGTSPGRDRADRPRTDADATSDPGAAPGPDPSSNP